jgi:hypothetical protein
MAPAKSESYQEACKMLPASLIPMLDAFIEQYKFACLKHHGTRLVSPKVLAELLLMGWRESGEVIESLSGSRPL